MKTLGVISNREKDRDLAFTKLLVESIINRGGEVKVSSELAQLLGIRDENLDDEAVCKGSEVVLCLGGDGTFLNVARKAYKNDTPILGINLGNLGFLTEVEKNDIDKAVELVIQGKYSIEERMLLEGSLIREGKTVANDIALNDVVISRGALSRILHVKTYINNVFADSFPGDGLIVSSPTGSTAYSLSAGGPIVDPDIDLIIVTPICPHILYSRSFITTGQRVVKAVIDEEYCHDAMVTFDGQKGYDVRGGDAVEIRKASSSIKMVRINSKNFFNILRSKIYDRGEVLRKNEI